ncbi:MAG: helix-turn-helix domain-containing protein, partial [Telluria sp.]
KQWGIPHGTLSRYVSGERMPDFDTALKLTQEAGVDPAVAFETFARTEQLHKSKQFKLQSGFVQTDLLLILGTGGIAIVFFILCQMMTAPRRCLCLLFVR